MHLWAVTVTLKVVPEQAAPEMYMKVWTALNEGSRGLLQFGKPDWGSQYGGQAKYHGGLLRSGGGVDLSSVIEGEPVRLGMHRAH
jgi:hypothetical protein